MKKRKIGHRGFTLLEMIVVLFIISVVMMMVLPDLRASGNKAQLTTCEANQRLIRTQMEHYYLEKGNRYPMLGTGTSVEATDAALATLVDENFLQSKPVCPADADTNQDDLLDGQYIITYTDDGEGFQVQCAIHGELGL